MEIKINGKTYPLFFSMLTLESVMKANKMMDFSALESNQDISGSMKFARDCAFYGIASGLKKEGKKVLIASCDTFRAAAAEQLKIWSERSDCPIVEADKGGEDPSAVAFRSVKKAIDEEFDILLIDTAGRLQNKKSLMEELSKINRTINKASGYDADENILIIDARNGQNIINQISSFDEYINITGLIITKLDGTAKGGILLAITEKFAKPIYAIGVGEKIGDLREFNSKEFAAALLG